MPNLIVKKRRAIARAIRQGSRSMSNSDGTHSTHKMEYGEGDGKYKYQVNPTVFPKEDGTWEDLSESEDRMAAYNKAIERGEVFGFKSKRRAEKFAAGSWKKGDDRREAMKNYRQIKRESE